MMLQVQINKIYDIKQFRCNKKSGMLNQNL
jgi:hypothetical protein